MYFLKKLVLIIIFFFCCNSSFSQIYNQELITQLEQIVKADSYYRTMSIDTGKKYGWNSPQATVLMHKQRNVDIDNLIKVDIIIDQYGYPGKTLVGEDLMSGAFIVIQHSDPDVQAAYLPLLTDAANKGELKWSSLALMIDRVKTRNGEKQVYGSQMMEHDNVRQLYPIEDEMNVNLRRAKIGLSPLEEYLKTFGFDYKVPTAAGNLNPAGMYVDRTDSFTPFVKPVGGYEAIYSKIIYPKKAHSKSVNGVVIIKFTVDKNGSTKNIQVAKSLGSGCDEEALRVIREAKFTNTSGGDYEMRLKVSFPYKKN